MKKIGIVDYDAGNILSTTKALEKVGGKPEMFSPEKEDKYDKLIIPGVGAYAEGMKNLKSKGLIKPILDFAKTGKEVLGICLGLQLFTDEGTEFEVCKGLGLFKGRTVALKNYLDRSVRLPHIGWSGLLRGETNWDKSILLNRISENAEVYYVHSFVVDLEQKENIVAYSDYGGHKFVGVAKQDNVMGTQFHPEKSGEVGLRILKNFVES